MDILDRRKELHQLVDSIDNKNLEVTLMRLKKDLEIVGSRSDGTPITLGELKNDIEKSRLEIENGDYQTISQFKKEAGDW